MPMDYFVWAVVGRARRGWSTPASAPLTPAARRRSSCARRPRLSPPSASTPRRSPTSSSPTSTTTTSAASTSSRTARFHVQEREMAFATGRHMTEPAPGHAFTADHVAGLCTHVHDGRVVFHDGDDELAPGLSVHHLGGHTDGLQVVRVAHRRRLAGARLRRHPLLREHRDGAAVPDRVRRRRHDRGLGRRCVAWRRARRRSSPATTRSCSSATRRCRARPPV